MRRVEASFMSASTSEPIPVVIESESAEMNVLWIEIFFCVAPMFSAAF